MIGRLARIASSLAIVPRSGVGLAARPHSQVDVKLVDGRLHREPGELGIGGSWLAGLFNDSHIRARVLPEVGA